MNDIKISATTTIDPKTWAEAKAVLNCHYLSVSDALYLLMRHIADAGDLPFSCIIPGPTMIATREELERDDLPVFNTVEELMADLNSDEDDDEDAEDYTYQSVQA